MDEKLQKYAADCGLMSRRAAEKEIAAGFFTVNGEYDITAFDTRIK